jgi:hypothetical protein
MLARARVIFAHFHFALGIFGLGIFRFNIEVSGFRIIHFNNYFCRFLCRHFDRLLFLNGAIINDFFAKRKFRLDFFQFFWYNLSQNQSYRRMADFLCKIFHMTNSPPFLSGYRELKLPIIEDGIPAWPELFPESAIEDLRITVGPRHFSSQMMLEFISPDRVRLDPDALIWYSAEFDARTAKLDGHLITGCAMYWDPSTGRRGNDGSVAALIYRDSKNHLAFIHDILYLNVSENDPHPMATQCGIVLDFMRRHNQRIIALEVNGIGSALPEILRDAAARRGDAVIVQKIINHQNKELRIIDAIEPLLGTGRLHAHDRIRETRFLFEMLGWAPNTGGCGHDDGLDAVAGALRTNACPLRPAASTFRPITAKTDFNV